MKQIIALIKKYVTKTHADNFNAKMKQTYTHKNKKQLLQDVVNPMSRMVEAVEDGFIKFTEALLIGKMNSLQMVLKIKNDYEPHWWHCMKNKASCRQCRWRSYKTEGCCCFYWKRVKEMKGAADFVLSLL